MSSFADPSPLISELKEKNKHSPFGMKDSRAKNSIFIFAALFLVVGFMAPHVGVNVARASFLDIIRALVTINPLEVDVLPLADTEIEKTFKVETIVKNKGENRIENAEAQIFVPEGLVILRGDLVKQMGIIRGGGNKKVFWQVKGTEVGSYIITVKASGILEGTGISDEDSTLVEIIEKGTPGRRSLLQILLDFFSF